MSRMNADDRLQERYLQVKHEKEKYKQRQEELESAYQDAEERRREQEDRIAALERKLRDATRMAEQRAEEAAAAAALQDQLEEAETQLTTVKRTLNEKDQQLFQTKEELRDQQDILEQLELEREKRGESSAAVAAPTHSADDGEVEPTYSSEDVDVDADMEMDPLVLLQQQEEIARLMDLLDEEAERRRQVEAMLHARRFEDGSDEDVDGGSPELPGLPLDAEMELSLEAELTGMSLADEMAQSSAPIVRPAPPASPPAQSVELQRLENEKAEIQATLEAERARFAEEQARIRQEQERVQMDADARFAAEKAAQKAREEMEVRLAEEKVRVQAELDAERARFAAEQEQLRQQAAELEKAKRDAEETIAKEMRAWEERERKLKSDHEAELELQQTLFREMPPDDDDDDDEQLPATPVGPEDDLPTLPPDAEGGEDEKLAYEVMAAEHAAALQAKRQEEEDAKLARQLAGTSEQTSAQPTEQPEPVTANAKLHKQFPAFEPSAIDAILAVNNGDVEATAKQLRESANAFGMAKAVPTKQQPHPTPVAAPSSSYNPFGEPQGAQTMPQGPPRQSQPSMSFEQRKRELLAKKQQREREELEKSKQKALLEKGRRFRAEQEEMYRQAQARRRDKEKQQLARERAAELARMRSAAEAEARRRVAAHTRHSISGPPPSASQEFKVVLPSQEKLYEALMQDDEYGAAQRLGLGKLFDGRVSIKVTPASVHLVPNIKRQHKSHVHAKAWEWRLHEIAAVSLDGNVLALSVWMPGGDTVRAETYKFKMKESRGAGEVHDTLKRFMKEATERKDASMARDMQRREMKKSGRLRNLDQEFMRELRLNDEFIRIMSEETGVSQRDLADTRHFNQQFERMGPRSHKKLMSLRKMPPHRSKVDPAAERERSRADALRKSSRRDSKAKKERSSNGAVRSPDYAEVGPESEAPMLPPRPEVVDTRRVAWGEPDDDPLEVKSLS